MIRVKRRLVAILVMASFVTSGSACLRRQFPVKRQYVVAVERPQSVRRESLDAVLAIARVRTAPQYERKGFVYRTGDLTYADDFYNAFYVAPSSLVRTALFSWFSAAQMFRHVADVESLVESDLTLEARLDRFYVDLRPDEQAAAVVAVTVTLIDSSAPRAVARFERSYEEAEPVDFRNSDDYAAAWGTALTRLLSRVENDVATAAR